MQDAPDPARRGPCKDLQPDDETRMERTQMSNYEYNADFDVVAKTEFVEAHSKAQAKRIVDEQEHQKRMNSFSYGFFNITDIDMIPNMRFGNRKGYHVKLRLQP